MKITKQRLPKSQVELTIELSYEEFRPYMEKEAAKITLSGFRPGKTPYDMIKRQIGETKLLNDALPRIFQDTLMEAFEKEGLEIIGQPTVDIEKLDHGKSLTYKAIASLLPKTELGDYKNIKAGKKEVKAETAEIEKVLKELQVHQAKETIAERAAKEGDVINIDLNMLLEKVPLEGGQFKNHRMKLGEESCPESVNENLLGIKRGDEKEFAVLYPKDHFDKKLAGKSVTFQVKANGVYERALPEINDAFAKSIGKFDKLEDLKSHIEKIIKKDKEEHEQARYEGELLDKLVSCSNFDETPDILLESEQDKMIGELKASIESQGGKFEDYLEHIKKTRDDLKKDFAEQAVKQIKTALAIRKIAEIENIKVEEKEVEDEIASYKSYMSSKSYLSPEIEKNLESANYKNHLRNILINKKVIKKLAEWALSG